VRKVAAPGVSSPWVWAALLADERPQMPSPDQGVGCTSAVEYGAD
jgi:hypothetical protein